MNKKVSEKGVCENCGNKGKRRKLPFGWLKCYIT